MAKIYETKQDFEKDVLKDQAQDMWLKASDQAGRGAMLIGGSFLADLWNKRTPGKVNLLDVVSTGLGVVGVIESVRSWFTSSKAHSLELQKERLGPETIILPPDVPLPKSEAESKHCGCNKSKPYTDRIVQTSLVEQAIRQDLSQELKR